MNRIYRVPYTGTLLASFGDTDLCYIAPADDKPCRLVGWHIGQNSELGDAAEENLRCTIRHMTGTVTAGSNGSSVTPVPLRPGTDTAAGFTARCNDYTVATTSGTSTIMEEMAWNERGTPWFHWMPEELRPVCMQTEVLIFRCEDTVADNITVCMTFFVEELG